MEIKKLDEDKCKNLKDLFIEWHERHEEDVNELRIEVNKLKEVLAGKYEIEKEKIYINGK